MVVKDFDRDHQKKLWVMSQDHKNVINDHNDQKHKSEQCID